MANEIYELKINTLGLVTGVKAATMVLKGLETVASEVGEAITDAFSVAGYKDYLATVRRFGKNLTDQLLVMQLSFGKMKVAIADAFAPLASVVVPLINQAIAAVIQFAEFVGQFFRGLIWAVTGQDALAESAGNAAQAEEELASSASRAGSAVRRSLMGFDQINRLNAGSGKGSGSSVLESALYVPDTISKQVKELVAKIMAYLKPLLEIDFTPLREALARLGQAFTQLGELAGGAMQWLWFNVLTPFVAWVVETLAPALTQYWAAGLEMVNAAIEPVMTGMEALWQALQPVVDYIGQQVITNLQNWRSAFESLAQVFREHSPQITGILQNIGTVVSSVWQMISPILTAMSGRFTETFGIISSTVSTVTGSVLGALNGLTTYLSGVFTGDWKLAWEGIRLYLKEVINGIIGLLNSLLSMLVSAVNAAVRAVNKLSFKVPDWVPGLGGKTFSPNLNTITTPQIPYLARGAVLPANKPFLAMVGDQKHGTNIEAPLATIQEALGLVLQDSIASNMAGHEATVAVLGQILQAVLGIHIGDEEVAMAADRYNRKIAIMKGV